MTGYEMQQAIKQRRREQYYGGVAYAWNGPSGVIKLGVIPGIGGSWIIGHVAESGSHRAFRSAAFSGMYPTEYPLTLLECLHDWAEKRTLERVEP